LVWRRLSGGTLDQGERVAHLERHHTLLRVIESFESVNAHEIRNETQARSGDSDRRYIGVDCPRSDVAGHFAKFIEHTHPGRHLVYRARDFNGEV
jgi:hypothetical protein